MSLTTVAIELLYDRIDIASVRNGRVVAARRLPLSLPDKGTEWAKAVREVGQDLKPIVEELGLSDTRTAVVYRSPTQAVDLCSYELRSAAEACQAARLTCTDALPYAAASAVCRAVAVGRDRGGPKRKMHVVVAADRTDAVRAIVDMVQTAGLSFYSLTPVDAVTMPRLIARAIQPRGEQHGWLHFGEHSSFFLVYGDGALRFERTIGIGLRTIAQSLTRPIRLPGGDESVELNDETARKILHNHGIPDTDEIVLEDPPLTRRHIMPLIQPVLQRFLIELRQSLRFGIANEEERKSIAITVTGPGSRVPGFVGLLGWELRIDVTADESYAAYDHLSPASPGSELLDAVQEPRSLTRLDLQPADVAQRRQVEGLRKWLWAGAAAALMFLGVDWVRYQSKLAAAEQEIEALTTAVDAVVRMEKTRDQLLESFAATNGLKATIASEVDVQADLEAVLKELSRLTPRSIRLTSLQFRRDADGTTGRTTGRALPLRPPDLRTELQSFVDDLKASPLFDEIVLRHVTADPSGPAAGQRFEAVFSLVLLPGRAAVEVAAGDGEVEP